MRGSKATAAARTGSAILIPLFFLVALSALALGGCNTISGVGEDISAGGRAIDQTSEATQDKLTGGRSKRSRTEGTQDYQSGAY